MAKTKKLPPVRTPEARESQLISLAMDRAEELMLSGKASSQLLTHFLRLGTEKARYEREKLRADTELSRAKVENLQMQQSSSELLQKAIDAFTSYGSSAIGGDYYDDEDEEY